MQRILVTNRFGGMFQLLVLGGGCRVSWRKELSQLHNVCSWTAFGTGCPDGVPTMLVRRYAEDEDMLIAERVSGKPSNRWFL